MRQWILIAVCGVACVEPRDIGDDEDVPWSGWEETTTTKRVDVSVATWNVQELGQPGSRDYEAALEVVRRLDADVIGLNEVDEFEASALAAFAADAGYPTVVAPVDQPFGSLTNVVLSRFESRRVETPDGAALSNDPNARDVTRRPVVFTAEIPGTSQELTVVVQHWKSGFYEEDRFRRAVDSERTRQAAELGRSSDVLIVMGDVNEDVDDMEDGSTRFTRTPTSLPSSYSLGDDLAAELRDEGLAYRPFASLETLGLTPVQAEQEDGSLATRPSSGRRLDYIFVSDALRDADLESMVYNSRLDEAELVPDGVDKPDVNASNHASDHLPLVVRFAVTEP